VEREGCRCGLASEGEGGGRVLCFVCLRTARAEEPRVADPPTIGPFGSLPQRPMSRASIAHRQRMLAYLQQQVAPVQTAASVRSSWPIWRRTCAPANSPNW
jgi:hypothetical protein